jgi:predicted DCC family thiol-disulfide oxidoreductase YuxK
MNRLYVLYDSRCVLCRRIRDWLREQPSHFPVVLLAGGSMEARQKFPSVAPGELTVIAADGRLWKGDHAWVAVLFALKRYRAWARRLARPMLLPLARQAFAAVSEHRNGLGWWMGIAGEDEVARHLRDVAVPGCKL